MIIDSKNLNNSKKLTIINLIIIFSRYQLFKKKNLTVTGQNLYY